MYHERRGSGVFGGLLLENFTQALCRDVFVEAMPRLERAGYLVTAHTHDEWSCETPKDFGSLDEFLAIVTTPPSWAPDLPIAAKARISDRLIEITDAVTEAQIADNVLDNTVAELDEDALGEEDEDADDSDDVEEPIATPKEPMATPELASVGVCIHCRTPPDGTERVSAYNDAYLHPHCVDAFLRTRMKEEGIPWEAPKPAAPPPPPPPPPSDGPVGNSASDDHDFDIEALLRPAHPRGQGGGNGGYPHGEDASPSAGPASAEYIYKNAAGRLYMRVVRTTAKSFPTFCWSGGEWAAGWPAKAVPYRLPELLRRRPTS